jgi:two-component system NarL family response regulator
MTTTSIRLILADDHAIFRQGLKSLLRLRAGFHVVAEVARASDLLPTLGSVACDVLLLDLQMEEQCLLNDIKSLVQVVRVVVLTASERTEDVVTALNLGAHAVVQKRFAIETLTAAIRATVDGRVWIPPSLQAKLAGEEPATAREGRRLSPREEAVARCVAIGLRNAEVAERLAISETTVKSHLHSAFQKLGLRDRVALARYVFRIGLLSPRE